MNEGHGVIMMMFIEEGSIMGGYMGVYGVLWEGSSEPAVYCGGPHVNTQGTR